MTGGVTCTDRVSEPGDVKRTGSVNISAAVPNQTHVISISLIYLTLDSHTPGDFVKSKFEMAVTLNNCVLDLADKIEENLD